MVSNTIQCGFESHPGHPVGGPRDDGAVYSHHVRATALARLAGGVPIAAVSRELGIARSTLRAWRDDPSRCAKGECPRCEAVPLATGAYAALLGYYLGDGCVTVRERYAVLRVSCDQALPRVISDVDDCLRAVRAGLTVFHVGAPGTVVVQGPWKHRPCLLPQHGPGRKHERPIVLEPWQRAIVVEHPGDFLRGLFHSDGERVANWETRVVAGERRRYEYPRWQFSNRSEDIIALCCWALDLVGVSWRRSSRTHVSVSRRADVTRLDALIGPKA